MIADSSKPTVYGYSRVSTNMQDQECKAQKTAIEERYRSQFQAQGCFWGGHFVDPAVSAKVPFLQRPDGSRSNRVMKPGDVLIIPKMDRAFRSIIDFGVTIDVWKKRKLVIQVLDIGMDATTEVGEFVAGIMVLVAQWERRRIRNRIKESHEGLVLQGKLMGRRPYGSEIYRKLDSSGKVRRYLRPNAYERDVLTKMRRLVDDGNSLAKTADLLNKAGLFDLEGTPWQKMQIRWALRAHTRLVEAELKNMEVPLNG